MPHTLPMAYPGYFVRGGVNNVQYVYINKIHKSGNLPDFMYFINVNILGSQYAHNTNDLDCYVGLKMTD